MKLYGDYLSPFVRMSMITAMECGLGDRVQLVGTHVKPAELNPDMERLSPTGKIPILETEHGHALYDSRVIMEYFCHTAGNKKLLADEPSKHFRVLTLLALAQGLGDAAVSLRYETFARPKEKNWPEYEARLRGRLAAAFKELDSKWRTELAEINLGSIAVAVVLHYIDVRQLSPNWRKDFPALSDWQKSFAARDSFHHTEPKA